MALTPPPWHDPNKKPKPRVGIVPFARQLRRSSTAAERRLWKLLRDRKLRGHKFRRQHPVPPYILDFFCEELLLAIELDGGGHSLEENKAHDERRTQFLSKQGIRVVRIKNFSLLSREAELMNWLWREVEQLEKGEGEKQ